MNLGGWTWVAVIASLVAHVGEASAQEASVAPPATESAPDIVRLKNGGLLRGTISELVPGETVVIVTASGKTRELSMAEVDYAGPASQDPKSTPTPAVTTKDSDKSEDDEEVADERDEKHANSNDNARPYVTVQSGKARLFLQSEPAGLTFHRQSGTATSGRHMARGFDRLCTAPCKIEIPAGTELLSLSQGDASPAAPKAVRIPEGESEIEGSYEDNSGTRVAGLVTTVVGLGGGTLLGLTGAVKDGGPDLTMVGLGCGMMGVGGLLGVILMAQGDEATFHLRSRRLGGVSWPKATTLWVSGSL